MNYLNSNHAQIYTLTFQIENDIISTDYLKIYFPYKIYNTASPPKLDAIF